MFTCQCGRPDDDPRAPWIRTIQREVLAEIVSIIDRRDYERAVKLLAALVKRLDRKTVDALV